METNLLFSGLILPDADSEKNIRIRQWATQILKEYITKGFVLNEELLKNGQFFDRDYFDELLERIQEIRVSERRTYQKITDIFEQCSCVYEKNSEITRAFYTTVWNDLLPVSGKSEEPRNRSIYSKMIDYAELTAGSGELLRMKDWLDILNSYINEERRTTDDRKV